jgi:hypothetical protein
MLLPMSRVFQWVLPKKFQVLGPAQAGLYLFKDVRHVGHYMAPDDDCLARPPGAFFLYVSSCQARTLRLELFNL